MVTWNKNNNQLTIEQRLYQGWVYTLIGVLGIIFFPIGLIGLLVTISETNWETFWHIFDTTMLVFHFMTTLSIMMMYARFSSQSNRNYREKIIFNNDTESMSLYVHKQQSPYVIPYADISHIHTLKETGGPDYPDMYLVHVIKKDGAEFWISGYAEKQDKYFELVNAIAEHTGIAVKDASDLGTTRPQAKIYQPQDQPVMFNMSRYIKLYATADGECITVKAAKKTFSSYCIGIIAYLLFMTIPFYIIRNFMSGTNPVFLSIAAIIFIVMWYSILLMIFILSMKDYTIQLNDMGLKVDLKCKILVFIKSTIFVPRKDVLYVRTNRLDGGHFSLSLGISQEDKTIKTRTMAFMNIGTYTRNNIKSRFVKNEKLISLWVVPAGIKPGNGPLITDLLYIEKYIQDRLRLTEEAI